MREVLPSWNLMVVSIGHRRRVAVERGDHLPVPLLHEAAPHLAGAGQLLVVGVQLLVEEDELVGCARRPGSVAFTSSTAACTRS